MTLLDLIQSIDEYNTYLAEVTQMWIIDSQNCSVNTPLFYILVRTSYTDCELCPAMDTDSGESGHENVYLIGGYCTDRGWYLPPNDSLASKWYSHSKYQTKMDEWVESGRQSRNLN